MMVVSFLVAAAVLQATGIGAAAAAMPLFDRSPTSVSNERRALAVRSSDVKSTDHDHTMAAMPLFFGSGVAQHHSAATVAASTVPVAAPASPPSRSDASRRRRSLDTADPWSSPQRTWAAD
jgi:hypothetical protein